MNVKLLFFLVLILSACQSEQKGHHHDDETYPRHVGDIYTDSDFDDPNFEPCHDDLIFQYYNFGKNIQYEGEKRAIRTAFEKQYDKGNVKNEGGYITIRFIVNCEGETGRFRMHEIDKDYKDKTFDKDISEQILAITKSLDGWKTGVYDNKIYDYYQYLTFKIIDSEIVDILP